MKKEIIRLLALLIFGAAALTGCSIENHRTRHYDRYHHNRYHDNDHRDHDYRDRGY